MRQRRRPLTSDTVFETEVVGWGPSMRTAELEARQGLRYRHRRGLGKIYKQHSVDNTRNGVGTEAFPPYYPRLTVSDTWQCNASLIRHRVPQESRFFKVVGIYLHFLLLCPM